MSSPRTFKSALIANRSECATRLLHGVRKLGLTPHGVYVKGDVTHCRAFDQCPEAKTHELPSYTDADALIKLINAEKIDLILPGWGFLSERDEFARRVAAETNCMWVGPTAKNIEEFGLKDAARNICEKAAPDMLLPGSGYVKCSQDVLDWVDQQKKNGRQNLFPLILKPVGGGGGIGMKVIDSRHVLVLYPLNSTRFGIISIKLTDNFY